MLLVVALHFIVVHKQVVQCIETNKFSFPVTHDSQRISSGG